MAKTIAVKQRRTPPQRTCISCRQVFDKRRLNRVVRSPEGRIALDPSGKMSGRGAYLCSNPDCWSEAIKSHRLDRSFKMNVPAEALEPLRKHAEKLEEQTLVFADNSASR